MDLSAVTASWSEYAHQRERYEVARDRAYDDIRQAVAEGAPLRQVARTVGISHQAVAKIVKAQPAGSGP